MRRPIFTRPPRCGTGRLADVISVVIWAPTAEIGTPRIFTAHVDTTGGQARGVGMMFFNAWMIGLQTEVGTVEVGHIVRNPGMYWPRVWTDKFRAAVKGSSQVV